MRHHHATALLLLLAVASCRELASHEAAPSQDQRSNPPRDLAGDGRSCRDPAVDCPRPPPCGEATCGPTRVCQTIPKPPNTPCRSAVDPCDLDEVCDGIALDCPRDEQRALEIWQLRPAVDTTVWTADGKSGVNDLELRAACESKKESRAFLSFPRGGLPTSIEVRGVSLALCVTSKIGDAPVQLWAGSFPMPPTPGDFDTGWLSPPLAPLVQIPTANTALAIAGPSSWLDQASDIHLGLRVGGCPGANGGAVFVGSKSLTASPTCRAPLLAVRFCRADPSVSGYCNSAVDCSLTSELSCAVARCPNHRCEYEPVAAGSTCRASTGPCDVEEVCDGLKPTCPDDVPIVISSLTVSAKVAIVTKSGGVPSIKLGLFEAACVPGGQESRGLLHFLTPGLIDKKIYSASLAACHIKGIATAELHAIGLSLPFNKAHFSMASQGLAATLSQKTLGLETVALDPALVKAAPANAYRLELPATGPCLMWSGRRYGQSSSGGCSGWPVLTVKYCAGP